MQTAATLTAKPSCRDLQCNAVKARQARTEFGKSQASAGRVKAEECTGLVVGDDLGGDGEPAVLVHADALAVPVPKVMPLPPVALHLTRQLPRILHTP